MSPSCAAKTSRTDKGGRRKAEGGSKKRPATAFFRPFPSAFRLPPSDFEQGGALVMVMIIICVLSVVAANLLLTTTARYHTTFQSASWQESIVAAESGIDLAMNELRKRVVYGPSTAFGTNWTAVSPSGAAYTSYGHAFPTGAAPYTLSSHGGEGNTTTQLRVYVDVPGASTAPTTNFAVVPPSTGATFISQFDNPNLADPDGVDRSRWWYRIRALGIAGVSGPARPNLEKQDNRLRHFSFFTDWRTGLPVSSPQAARMVEAVVKPLTNFRNALMADKQIDLNNVDVLVDSYDSSKGFYNNPGNVGTMGNIATNGQLINANHATVKGDALTNNGAVKSGDNVTGQQSSSFYQELTPLTTAQLNPNWSGVKDGGTLTTDATYTASASPTSPTLVRLDGINLPDGGHVINFAAPASAAKSATPAPSFVKVYVQGDIVTTGSSYINLANGVNAIFYFSGNVNLQGNGIINNTFLASHLVFNGIQPTANADGTFPTRTINIATTQDFEGILYAPNHDLTLALQAVPSSTATGTTATASSGHITSLQNQIASLKADLLGNQLAYARDSSLPGSGNAWKAAQDQQQINKDQSDIDKLTQELQLLVGVNPDSSAADHAMGYNGIYGGFVGKTIIVASKTHVHYDETLRQAGTVNHYEIVSWFEDNVSRDATGGVEAFWWKK